MHQNEQLAFGVCVERFYSDCNGEYFASKIGCVENQQSKKKKKKEKKKERKKITTWFILATNLHTYSTDKDAAGKDNTWLLS